jgi:hypothetical protein
VKRASIGLFLSQKEGKVGKVVPIQTTWDREMPIEIKALSIRGKEKALMLDKAVE